MTNQKLFILLIIISLCTAKSFSQVRYVAWYGPSDVETVHGLMVDFWEFGGEPEIGAYPTINGIDLNVNPVGLFTPLATALHAINPKTHSPTDDNPELWDNHKALRNINGLKISLVTIDPHVVNGLDLNVTGSFHSKVNGLTISGVMNKQITVNGITLAPIGNHNMRCRGLQIGLINTCRDLKGFQIGLWNVNQKRKIPFINWAF